MIDSLYGYAAKEEQIDGLRKLGLNPATMKYLGGPDWDLVAKTAQNTPPKKDMVASDDYMTVVEEVARAALAANAP